MSIYIFPNQERPVIAHFFSRSFTPSVISVTSVHDCTSVKQKSNVIINLTSFLDETEMNEDPYENRTDSRLK